MKVRLAESGSALLSFQEIEPFFIGLLRRLPESANPGDDFDARERLFSDPMAPDDGQEFNADWRDYVQPDLYDLFRTAREIVTEDLAALPSGPGEEPKTQKEFDPAQFVPTEHTLEIPSKHADAWLSVLNQARLVLSAKHDFGEREMNMERPFPPFHEEGEYALFQVHFYDDLQEILLRVMDGDS
jgi:hypothetical protein